MSRRLISTTTGRAVLLALPAVLPIVVVLGVSLAAALLQSLGLLPFIGSPGLQHRGMDRRHQ